MNKINELIEKFDSLVNGKVGMFDDKYSTAPEIGFDELDALWDQLEEIKKDANKEMTDYLLGMTRASNGQIASANTLSFNVTELAKISGAVDSLTDKIYDMEAVIYAESNKKHALYLEKGRIRNSYKTFIVKNENTIENLNKNISDFKLKLGENAPVAGMEEMVKSLIQENELLKDEMDKITTEMDILKNGGILPEPKVDFVEEDVATNDETVENENISKDSVVEDEVVAQDETTEQEVEKEDIEEDNKHNWDSMFADGQTAITDPNMMITDGSEKAIPLPGDLDQEVDNALGLGTINEDVLDEEDLPVEPEDDDDELDEEDGVFIAKTKEAPKTLKEKLKNIFKIAGAALAALGVIGAGYHHVYKPLVNEYQESQNDEEDLDEDKDPIQNDPTPSDPTPSNPTPSDPTPSDPTPSDPTPSDPTPSDPSPSDPTPSDPTPSDPTPSDPTPSDPTPSDPTPEIGVPTEIAPGESIVNQETGVEVTYDGSAFVNNEDGSITEQEDRNLTYTGDETAIVNSDDLQPDNTAEVPAVTTDQLTEGERENVQNSTSEEDWMAAFENDYGISFTK